MQRESTTFCINQGHVLFIAVVNWFRSKVQSSSNSIKLIKQVYVTILILPIASLSLPRSPKAKISACSGHKDHARTLDYGPNIEFYEANFELNAPDF